MTLLRALLLVAHLVVFLHSITCAKSDSIYVCKSRNPEFIPDEKVDQSCSEVWQPTHKIIQNPSLSDVVKDMDNEHAIVLHSRISRIYSANNTWNAFVENDDGVLGPHGCRLTAKMYYAEIENLCIFKGYDHTKNPEYKLIGRYLRLDSHCPLKGLSVGQEFVFAVSSWGVDNVKDDANDQVGVVKLRLDNKMLFEASEKVLDQVARVCGLEDAKPPADAPLSDSRFKCPLSTVTKEMPCDKHSGATSPLSLSLSFLSATVVLQCLI